MQKPVDRAERNEKHCFSRESFTKGYCQLLDFLMINNSYMSLALTEYFFPTASKTMKQQQGQKGRVFFQITSSLLSLHPTLSVMLWTSLYSTAILFYKHISKSFDLLLMPHNSHMYSNFRTQLKVTTLDIDVKLVIKKNQNKYSGRILSFPHSCLRDLDRGPTPGSHHRQL